MYLNLIIGPPASGKTTIAATLPNSVSYLSIGDATRRELELGSELGRQLQFFLDSLKPYPNEILAKLFRKMFTNVDGTILVDGIPRGIQEVSLLEQEMAKRNLRPGVLIVLRVDKTTAFSRTQRRLVCPYCHHQVSATHTMNCPMCSTLMIRRIDDRFETFSARFSYHTAQIESITSKLVEIGFKATILDTGSTSVQDMATAIAKLLQAH